MIIANPIFDTVFKRLMENNRVARFFVETLIDEPVESITLTPQEHTYFKSPQTIAESGLTAEELENIKLLSIIRFDFIATIRTAAGYKKVLIEIQKARNAVDLMRFRTYLAEQYKRKDIIEEDGKKLEEPLPIITIYLLGFELTETDAVAIRVNRTYCDMIARKELHLKSEFIECLTHDSYVVQIPRIEGKTRTRLEKMLSVFEQKYFVDDKGIIKMYTHPLDDEDVRCMVEILYHTGADPEQQREIEDEWWSNELLASMIGERDKRIEEQKKALEEKEQVIAGNKKALEEKEQVIAGNKKTLEEKEQVIAGNKKTLEEKEQVIAGNKKTLEDKDRLIEAMQKEIERLKGKQEESD